jgi:phosphoribosyl-ATP pyrophosphohydrolase/phosphoribosyl-AMP cyclohydrolase
MSAAPDFTKGLLPAIVQHAHTGAVLMLGYMDEAAWQATLATGRATFFSRSRQCQWVKGETSGNWLEVTGLRSDCDADAILVRALPKGPTCHLGTASCFGDPAAGSILEELDAVIAQRLAARPEGSYVAGLAEGGVARAAQKLGEEGVELALAAVSRDAGAVAEEAADLVFHLLALLAIRGVPFEAVLERLASRRR